MQNYKATSLNTINTNTKTNTIIHKKAGLDIIKKK